METTVTFRSLSALFRPEQCTTEPKDFFGVSAEYDQKLTACIQEASNRAFHRFAAKVDHATCVQTVMRELTVLVDEQCPPSSAAELAHVFYLAGMATYHINRTIDDRLKMAAVMQEIGRPDPNNNPAGWHKNAGVA